jgi:hypothetical protein
MAFVFPNHRFITIYRCCNFYYNFWITPFFYNFVPFLIVIILAVVYITIFVIGTSTFNIVDNVTHFQMSSLAGKA